MVRNPISVAKEHIIRELTKQLPMNPLVQSSAVDDGMMPLKLDANTRKDLEEKAFSQGEDSEGVFWRMKFPNLLLRSDEEETVWNDG